MSATQAPAYTETDETVATTFRRVHANGEQTHVAILTVSDRDYAAVAYDVDPRDMSPGPAACIAHDPTIEGVYERATRWMDRNPKGVAGQTGGPDSGGGTLAFIKRAAGKLNDYGNQQREQLQQPGDGNGGES